MLRESDQPLTAAPPRPPRRDDPDALFEEARQHRRERRLRLALILALLVVAGSGVYAAFSGGSSSSAAGNPSRLPIATSANPTVVLLVDVSGSMRARDIKPSRIAAVRSAMRTFVARLPKSSKVGVIAFSSDAQVYAAPTLDRKVVSDALGRLTPEAGTALGDGLGAAVTLAVGSLDTDGIHHSPGHFLPALIVLASDGAQNRGALTPAQAAKLAKAAGIRVDGIALGTPGGNVTYGYGLYHQAIPVPPDPKTVESIAKLTGGQAFVALDAGRLDAVYGELGSKIGH
ncbi:MAG TPA: VWA domain-containing protein [Gaiellaceae bacterium]|nr:VWA domain-containing protein [Gaiellaceae bacterium]